MFVGGSGATKREGEGALPEPAVSKPRPAVPPAVGTPMVSLASAIPVPASESSVGDPATRTVADLQMDDHGDILTQSEMMAIMKKDLAEAMREELDATVNRVVQRTFGRITENIAKVEAKTVQNTRQLVEIRQEMVQQTAEVTTLRGAVEALTSEVQAMRLEASGSRAPPLPQASPTPWAPSASQPPAQAFSIHTPRPNYAQEKAVLLIWPHKMIPDHYKLMHMKILSEYLTQDEIDSAEPNFPRNANRYGVTFADRATAVKFHSAVKAKPYVYRHTEDGETITVRASWPTTPEQQARGRLFKPIFDALNVGDLAGHLRISYPRGPKPVTVVSVGLSNGAMEDILRVHFSDTSDHPTIVDLDFGGILTQRPEVLNNAGIAAGITPQASAGATGTQGPTGGGGVASASGSA